MRKRYMLAGLLAVLLVVAVTAVSCGGNGTTTTSGVPTTAAPTTAAPTTAATGAETTAPPTTGAATGKPIKVGHIVDLTGYEATVGNYFKQGLEYAFNTAGNQVAGRPLQIIVEDSKSTTQGALDAAKKLVESDGVDIVLGPTQEGQKSAVADYCKEAGIPLVFYNPTTPALLQSGNEWIIGSGGTTAQCPSCMADYAYTTLGYRSVVTITEDEDGARAFMDPFVDTFKKLGGTVVQQQWTSLEATDFASYLTALKKADAVVAWEAGSQAITFLIQYHALGIDKKMPLIANYHGGFIDPWIPYAVAGANAEAAAALSVTGPFVYSPDSQDPAWQAYVKGMTAVLGKPPTDGATNCTVQAATMLLAALQATGGDTTPAKLRDALLKTQVTGPQGPQSFAQGDQAATVNVYIVQIQKVPNQDFFKNVTLKTYANVPPAGFTGQ